MKRGTSEPTNDVDADLLECRVVEVAVSGRLAAAGREAVAEYQRLGIPRLTSRDGKLIRVHPDGREEVLEELFKTPFKRPPNVQVLGPK